MHSRTEGQILQMDIYTYTIGQGTSPVQDKLSWGRFPYVSPAMVEKQKAAQKAAAEESKKPVDQRKPYKFTKDQPTPRALYLDNSTRYHYAPVVGFRWTRCTSLLFYLFTLHKLMKDSLLWMNNK